MRDAVNRLWPELEWISDPALREATARTWVRALEESPLSAEDLETMVVRAEWSIVVMRS